MWQQQRGEKTNNYAIKAKEANICNWMADDSHHHNIQQEGISTWFLFFCCCCSVKKWSSDNRRRIIARRPNDPKNRIFLVGLEKKDEITGKRPKSLKKCQFTESNGSKSRPFWQKNRLCIISMSNLWKCNASLKKRWGGRSNEVTWSNIRGC